MDTDSIVNDTIAIAGHINAIIVDILDCDSNDVVPVATFDDLKADSLDVNELLMRIEDEFDIDLGHFDDMDLESLMATTVGEVVEAVLAEVRVKGQA